MKMVWKMLWSVFLHSGSGWGIEIPRLSSSIPKMSGRVGDDLLCEQILCQKIYLIGWDPQRLHPLGLWHSIKNLKWVIGKKGSCHVLSTLLAKRLYYFALLLSEIFLKYKFNQAGANSFKLTNWLRQRQCGNAHLWIEYGLVIKQEWGNISSRL